MFSVEFTRFFNYYQKAKDLNQNAVAAAKEDSGDTTRFFINVGRKDDFDWMKLKDFLKEMTGLGQDGIYRVDCKDSFSFFNTDTEHKDKVLALFEDFQLEGRRVSVEETQGGGGRDRNRGGGGGRDRNRGGGGRRDRNRGGGDRRRDGKRSSDRRDDRRGGGRSDNRSDRRSDSSRGGRNERSDRRGNNESRDRKPTRSERGDSHRSSRGSNDSGSTGNSPFSGKRRRRS